MCATCLRYPKWKERVGTTIDIPRPVTIARTDDTPGQTTLWPTRHIWELGFELNFSNPHEKRVKVSEILHHTFAMLCRSRVLVDTVTTRLVCQTSDPALMVTALACSPFQQSREDNGLRAVRQVWPPLQEEIQDAQLQRR